MACTGILVWFELDDGTAAILECSACDYLIVTGSFNDPAHAECEIVRAS